MGSIGPMAGPRVEGELSSPPRPLGAAPDQPPAAQGLAASRLAMVLGQVLLLGLANESPAPEAIPWLAVSWVVPAAGIDLWLLLRARERGLDDERRWQRHLLLEVALLAGLVAAAGGPAHPFQIVCLLPLAVAAATLPAAAAWRVAAAAVAGLLLLRWLHLPLPGAPALPEAALGWAAWAAQALLALSITYLVLRLVAPLRERAQQLDEVCDYAVRAESALAIGSVAAGAAHELATPLTTIGMLVDEMRDAPAPADDAERRHQLDVIADSVAECRRSLDTLRRSVAARTQPRQRMPLGDFVDRIVGRYRAMCPQVQLTTRIAAGPGRPAIEAELALEQAVLNLLVNAGRASPEHVELHVECCPQQLTLRIADRGPGIAPEIAALAGRRFVSTRSEGSAMGLFLTQITTQRLRGRFTIGRASGGGTVAEIVLPAAALVVRE